MDFVYLGIGVLVGGLIGFLLGSRKKNELDLPNKELEFELVKLQERLENASKNYHEQKEFIDNQKNELLAASKEASQWKSAHEALSAKLQEQKLEMENLHAKLSDQFKVLANEILDEKTKKFTDQNRSSLDQILNPLKEKIKDFEDKVEKSYNEDNKERITLKAQIDLLMELNKSLDQEAKNLTSALKGDAKKQGNWGEMVLQKILESSGLEEGINYVLQGKDLGLKAEDGSHQMPDAIVHLPENKHIIIDSKVSLVAYEKLVNADSEENRLNFKKQHITSIKNHVKDLSDKNYQSLKGLNPPDFVLLFMPIESSFSIAIQADQDLFAYAWDRKVVIVSPSTLLATLKTVSSIWKHEKQNKNAMEIALKAGQLYDKFNGFIADLEKIGKSLSTAQTAYTDAHKKLTSGSGNLVGRAENLRKLGAKTNKALGITKLEEDESID